MRQHCYKHTHCDGELLVWQLLKKTIYGINLEFSDGSATEINGGVPEQWLPEHVLPTTPFPDELLPGDSQDPDDPDNPNDPDNPSNPDDPNNPDNPNNPSNPDNPDVPNPDTPDVPDTPDPDDPNDPDNPDNPDDPNDPDDPDTPDNPDQPSEPETPVKYNVYVGATSIQDTGITSFKDVTADAAKSLTILNDGVYNRYQVTAGQFNMITVIVPPHRKAYMDDGLGGKVPFYTNSSDKYGEPFYSNGEITLTIDDVVYNVYGVFTAAASGLLYIYVE